MSDPASNRYYARNREAILAKRAARRAQSREIRERQAAYDRSRRAVRTAREREERQRRRVEAGFACRACGSPLIEPTGVCGLCVPFDLFLADQRGLERAA